MIINNLWHRGKDTDKYKDYLVYVSSPKNKLRNSKNIFDDLNSTDAKWFKLARAYLNKRVHLTK